MWHPLGAISVLLMEQRLLVEGLRCEYLPVIGKLEELGLADFAGPVEFGWTLVMEALTFVFFCLASSDGED